MIPLNTAYLNADNSTDRERQYTVLINDTVTQVQFGKTWTAPSILVNGTGVKHAELHRLDPKAPPLELLLMGGYWRYDGRLHLLRFAPAPVRRSRHTVHPDMFRIDPQFDLWRFDAECRIHLNSASQMPGLDAYNFLKQQGCDGMKMVGNAAGVCIYQAYSSRSKELYQLWLQVGNGKLMQTEAMQEQ